MQANVEIKEGKGINQDIDSLKVNDKWKRRFRLFRSLNVDELSRFEWMKSANYKSLKFSERFLITNNFWAFFGSFIYYYIKGMPQKATVLLAFSFIYSAACIMLEVIFGFGFLDLTYISPIVFFCFMYANIDFYNKTFHSEKMWPFFSKFLSTNTRVVMFLLGSLFLFGASLVYIAEHTYETIDAASLSDYQIERLYCDGNIYNVSKEQRNTHGEAWLCADLLRSIDMNTIVE